MGSGACNQPEIKDVKSFLEKPKMMGDLYEDKGRGEDAVQRVPGGSGMVNSR